MTHEAVTSFLTELRTAALQSPDKCRIFEVADTTIRVERKARGWEYRINGLDFSLRHFEQALMMATSLPVVAQLTAEPDATLVWANFQEHSRTSTEQNNDYAAGFRHGSDFDALDTRGIHNREA